MIRQDNLPVGFIYKDGEPIDKIYGRGVKIFEQGFLREQSGQRQITTEYLTLDKDVVNYRIYGNTNSNSSVGDLTTNKAYRSTIYNSPLGISGVSSISGPLNVVYNSDDYTYTVNGTAGANGNLWFSSKFSPGIAAGTEVRARFELLSGEVTPGSYLLCSLFNYSQTEYIRTTHTFGSFPHMIDVNDNMPSGDYFSIGIQYSSGTTFTDAKYRVKLEIASEAINTFEPPGYRIPVSVTANNSTSTHNIYLDAPLRSYQNYQDYIDYKTQKVYRNVVVDGNTISGTSDVSGTAINLPALRCGADAITVFNVNTTVQPSAFDIVYRSRSGQLGQSAQSAQYVPGNVVDSDVGLGDNDIDIQELE